MSSTTPRTSTTHGEDVVAYGHTGLAAPYRMTVADVKSVPAEGDGLITADVVHPKLGIIGQVYNLGNGSGTKFLPSDPIRFSIDNMQAFAEQCTERGREVGGGFTPIESLMNLLLIEYDFDAHVTEMVRAGRQSLLRLVDDADQSIREYAEVVSWSSVLFDRRDRARAARALRTQFPDLEPSQSWELWTGTSWIPLQHEVLPIDPAHTARLAELRQARMAWQASGDERPSMHSYGPTAEGRYVSDRSGKPDSYLLADAPGVFETWRWCRCKTGPRSRRVRIEHWEGSDGLVGSGWAHASCRRLINMD